MAYSDRRYAIWLAEEEEYALYGMFYQKKHIIRDDRPSTVVEHKPQDRNVNAAIDLQESKKALLSSKTLATLAFEPNQTIKDLENFLDVDV